MSRAENGLVNASGADRAAAVRLLACACVAIALGGGAVLLGRAAPPAATAEVAAVQPKSKDQVIEAPTEPPAEGDGAEGEEALGRHAVGGYEATTPGGMSVVSIIPQSPLTVRERARLRVDASAQADVVETVEPGRPLRVVGAVLTGRDPQRQESYWLQVRRGNGNVAYVQASVAADLAAWRRAQAIARQRQNEQDAAAAAAASGIEIPPAPLPPELTGGAPLEVLPPPPIQP